MDKDARINFRINSYLLKLLKNYCYENNISISGLVMIFIQDLIVNDSVSSKLKDKLKIYIIRVQRKDLFSKLYITKNMDRRVMDMSLSNYFTTGNINMIVINSVLDSFVAEFENYDTSIKNKIGIDFKLTVKKLRNKEFLLGQSRNYKMLSYVADKK